MIAQFGFYDEETDNQRKAPLDPLFSQSEPLEESKDPKAKKKGPQQA